MTKTKKSLTLSVLALFLCIAMLIGTTFAWFTDSVSSGKNTIKAGNLDVELMHYTTDSSQAESVKDKTNLFNVSLWEPGVIAYENFIVSNEGTLALKYALNLNVFDKNAVKDTNKDLTQVIKVAVVDGGFIASGDPTADRVVAQQITDYQKLADFQKTGKLKAKGTDGQDSNTYGVVLYWDPTDHDDDYNLNNGKTSTDGQPLFVDFGVNLVATQDTVENDSFDSKYDISAELPVIASFPSIKKTDITDASKSLTINKQGALESAEVKATGAKTVFESLEDKTEGRNNDMTLTLNVNETGNKEKDVEGGKKTTINLDINMSAVMRVTDATTGALIDTKKNDSVEKLDEFTTIKLDIGKYSSVSVLHKGKDMEQLASATDIPTDTENGGYFYDGEQFAYIVTKTFSPFTFNCITYKTKLNYTTTKFGDEDVKIVTFAGKEWIVMEENDNSVLMLSKDNVSAAYYNTNNSTLYKDSDLDKAMNAYYDTLSESDKELLVKEKFKESIYITNRGSADDPGVYLEAGNPLIDEYNTNLNLQGVELLNGSNTYDIERYVFALSRKDAEKFGAKKLASVSNDGLLDYTKYGDVDDQAFYLRTAHTFRRGFLCDAEVDGTLSYIGAPYYTAGVRPAVKIDLNKAYLVKSSIKDSVIKLFKGIFN